jgi:CheY-like chemotaxis protein
MGESPLNHKRILAVDDEPDVLEILEEQLDEFEDLILDTATDYQKAYHLVRSWSYDLVILDIMGVRGFDLLNASVSLGFPTVMLTAHALSVETLKKSVEMGARAYVPKEKLTEIVPFLEDVLTLSPKSGWQSLLKRLGAFFDRAFGAEWEKDEKLFWEQVRSGHYEPKAFLMKKKK